MDKVVLFFLISMMTLILYRMFVSILLLCKKQNIIDEKFYVCFFYVSIIDVLCVITKNITLCFILVLLTPIILTLYVAFSPTRIYWIINGYDLTTATYNNQIRTLDEKYNDLDALTRIVSLEHKRKERKIKVIINSKSFEEKELILNKIKEVIKEKSNKANKIEIAYLVVYSIFLLILCALLIVVLFT